MIKIAKNTYQHVSYLKTQDFGKVNCNGMIVINKNQAVIFDTPADNESSEELIQYVNNTLKAKIIALIPTHFHQDCIGGLDAFINNKSTIYISGKTLQYLENKHNEFVSQVVKFDEKLELSVGNEMVYALFLGSGHTKDNLVGYFPADKTLFGGCLVKELNASKGNLEDADTLAWSNTISKLKSTYPKAKYIIPGHGKLGGMELLDYTESLFKI